DSIRGLPGAVPRLCTPAAPLDSWRLAAPTLALSQSANSDGYSGQSALDYRPLEDPRQSPPQPVGSNPACFVGVGLVGAARLTAHLDSVSRLHACYTHCHADDHPCRAKFRAENA